jgi:hypothetical protein
VNPTPILRKLINRQYVELLRWVPVLLNFSYLSAALHIPCMSSSTYFAVENQVLNNVKKVAINEMIDAGQEELRLALEAGEVDSNGVGMITVIVDGAWSKRSYKTNYNALSGVASINWCSIKKSVIYRY